MSGEWFGVMLLLRSSAKYGDVHILICKKNSFHFVTRISECPLPFDSFFFFVVVGGIEIVGKGSFCRNFRCHVQIICIVNQ